MKINRRDPLGEQASVEALFEAAAAHFTRAHAAQDGGAQQQANEDGEKGLELLHQVCTSTTSRMNYALDQARTDHDMHLLTICTLFPHQVIEHDWARLEARFENMQHRESLEDLPSDPASDDPRVLLRADNERIWSRRASNYTCLVPHEKHNPGGDGDGNHSGRRVFNQALLLLGREAGRVCPYGRCSKACSRVVLDAIISESESMQLREYGHRITPAWSTTTVGVAADDAKTAHAEATGDWDDHKKSCPPNCMKKENLNMLKSAFLGQMQHADEPDEDGSTSGDADVEEGVRKHTKNTQREHLLLLRVVERLRRAVQYEHGLPASTLHPASVFMTQLSDQLKVTRTEYYINIGGLVWAIVVRGACLCQVPKHVLMAYGDDPSTVDPSCVMRWMCVYQLPHLVSSFHSLTSYIWCTLPLAVSGLRFNPYGPIEL
jgi:hypothetical protein